MAGRTPRDLASGLPDIGPGQARQLRESALRSSADGWRRQAVAKLIYSAITSLDGHVELELVDEHRFGNGVVHVHHRCSNQP